MNFVKNQKKGFMAYLIVAILTVISLGIYVSNVLSPYYEDMDATVVLMLAGTLILIAGALIFSEIIKGTVGNVITDFCRVGVSVLIILAGTTFISMRVESFGYIFGSNLEMGNEAAFQAGRQAIMGIIFLVVAWIISLVSAFIAFEKKK